MCRQVVGRCCARGLRDDLGYCVVKVDLSFKALKSKSKEHSRTVVQRSHQASVKAFEVSHTGLM